MRDPIQRDPAKLNWKQLEIKCPMCGGRDFEFGKIHPSDQQFVTENDSSSLLAKLWLPSGRRIQAARCQNCGFVALYA